MDVDAAERPGRLTDYPQLWYTYIHHHLLAQLNYNETFVRGNDFSRFGDR